MIIKQPKNIKEPIEKSHRENYQKDKDLNNNYIFSIARDLGQVWYYFLYSKACYKRKNIFQLFSFVA